MKSQKNWNWIMDILLGRDHRDYTQIGSKAHPEYQIEVRAIEKRLKFIDRIWSSLAFANALFIFVYLYKNQSSLYDRWRKFKGIEPKVLRRKDGSVGNFPANMNDERYR